VLEYNGFLIEPFETEPGRWRAEITRPDGRKIKTFPDGQEHDFIRTGGAEAFSAEAAIKMAMRLIEAEECVKIGRELPAPTRIAAASDGSPTPLLEAQRAKFHKKSKGHGPDQTFPRGD
jgi:hypothetical protein